MHSWILLLEHVITSVMRRGMTPAVARCPAVRRVGDSAGRPRTAVVPEVGWTNTLPAVGWAGVAALYDVRRSQPSGGPPGRTVLWKKFAR